MGQLIGGLKAGTLARLPHPQMLEREMSVALQLLRRMQTVSAYRIRSCLEETVSQAAQIAAAIDFRAVAAALASRKKPAGEELAAKHLALLVGSFPSAKPGDADVYGTFLIEEVLSTNPSVGAIEDGCRYLRRTSTFLPSIAEVVRAIQSAEDRLSEWTRVAEQFDLELLKTRARIAQLDQERAEVEERRRAKEAQQKELIRRMIESGEPTSAFRFSEVYAVKLELGLIPLTRLDGPPLAHDVERSS
jgi:hypothetical protein